MSTEPTSVAPVPIPAPGPASRAAPRLRRAFADSGLEHLSVRWRFRLVVVAFGLPFLVYIVWAAAHDAAIEKQRVLDRAQAGSALVASRFGDQIEQIDRLLATLAQSLEPQIHDGPAITSLLVNIRAYVPAAVNNIAVWNLRGENIGALDRRTAFRAVNVADRDYFKKAVARRDLAFEGPIESRTTSVRILQFARPVFNPQNEVIAVISMSVRSDDLVNFFDPDGAVRKDALMVIVNDGGVVLSRSVEPEPWVGRTVTDAARLAHAFKTKTGADEEVWSDGQRRLVGYSVVPQWPWLIKVAMPLDGVLGKIGAALIRDLGLGLTIFGVALQIAGRVAAWTTRPLMQLAVDAERLGRGDFAHRSAVVAGGEVGTLAENFNRMAGALEQRNAEVVASQNRLRAVADNIPEHVTYFDRDERFQYVNAFNGAFPRHAPVDMVGRTILEVRGPEFYAVIEPAIRSALDGREFSGEISVPVDGRVRHFFVTYVPDRAVDGSVIGVYAFAQDITVRKDAELKRVESEKRLSAIADNVPALICYLDRGQRFRFVNRAFEEWFRRPMDAILGQTMTAMMVPDVAAKYTTQFDECVKGMPTEFEVEVPSHARGTRWLKCNFFPDFGASGDVEGVYGLISNVTDAKLAEQRLTRLARFDTLTGLANRHQFNEALDQVLSNDRGGSSAVALMFLDIDHFKQVNDRYGHACGDALLKDFARRLSDSVRPTDIVARLSGDEFVVLLEGMHSEDEPQFIARKIIAVVEKPFVIDDHRLRVTTSIGIALRAHAHESASVLMKRADEALYDAKRAGRNTFRLAV